MDSSKKHTNKYDVSNDSPAEIINLSKSEIDLLIKAGRRTSIICDYDWESLINFSYRFVKQIAPDYLKDQKIIELIQEGLKEKGIEFIQPDPKDVIYFSLWVKDELESISKMESENLSKQPKPEMIAAGVDRFDKYGNLNVVYGICERFGWTIDYVWSMNYEEVFTIQLHAKDSGEFNEALNEFYKKKKK